MSGIDDLIYFCRIKLSSEFQPPAFHIIQVAGNTEQVRFEEIFVLDLIEPDKAVQNCVLQQILAIFDIAGDCTAEFAELLMNGFVKSEEFYFVGGIQ